MTGRQGSGRADSPSSSDASHSGSAKPMADRLLDVLRLAHEDVERKMAAEMQKHSAAQQATRRELEEARSRNVELQKELEKMATQKNYVADAFETSRKEAAKLRTENRLANEELVRLRRAVEEATAERVAAGVGQCEVPEPSRPT